MSITRFEDILSWQKSKLLVIDIYKQFSLCKDYAFRDQIQRAAVSIMNNIAEGFERNTNKEFTHFLYIAKGSCGEVRSMLQLAIELNYIKNIESGKLINQCTEISRMIFGLIRTLQK